MLSSWTCRAASPARVPAALPSASGFPLVCLLYSSTCLPVLSVHFCCADPIWKQPISGEVWAPSTDSSRAQGPEGLGFCFQTDPHFPEWGWGSNESFCLGSKKNTSSKARDLGLVQKNCNSKNCTQGWAKEPKFSQLRLVPT